MTDYTPPTEEVPVRVTDGSVRECVMYANLLLRGESTNSIGTPLTVEISKKYDGWLAARDRKIAAKTLRDFADTLGVNAGDEDDEWWRGYRQGQREALHKASDRADRIEQGGES